MKIVSVEEFKKRVGGFVKELDKYLIVANENIKDRSFIVTSLNEYRQMALSAGDMVVVEQIDDAIEQISKKVSARYKLIRSKR